MSAAALVTLRIQMKASSMARIRDRYWSSFGLPLNDHLAMHMVLDLRNRIYHGSFLKRSFIPCEDFIYMGVCLWGLSLAYRRLRVLVEFCNLLHRLHVGISSLEEDYSLLFWLMRSFVNTDESNDLPLFIGIYIDCN